MADASATITLPVGSNVGSLIHIDVKEFTNNVIKDAIQHIVSGDGIFDILMMTATKHLQAQFEGNRIRKEDYATAYVEIYQATLQAALQAWLQKGVAEADIALKLAELPLKEKQLELMAAQIDLMTKQIEAELAKRDLYRRQIEGFDEDYKQKILKICMDSWAVGFSVAKDAFQAEGTPAPMQKPTIDDLYNKFIKVDLDNNTYKRSDEVLNGYTKK